MTLNVHAKIAIVDDFSPYSCSLVNEGLTAEKVDVVFYGPRKRLNKFYPECRFLEPKNIWTPQLFPFQIFRQVVADKPDVVHIQHEISTFGPFYTNMLFPLLLLLLQLERTRIVVTEHCVLKAGEFGTFTSSLLQTNAVNKLVLLSFYMLIAKLVNVIIVHDLTFKRQLIECYRIRENKVVVIPYGSSICRPTVAGINSHNLSSRLNNKRIILYFGFLSPRKGIEYLLRAFKKIVDGYPNCMLVIGGDAPAYYKGYRKELEALTSSLGLEENVLFTGFVANEVANFLFSISEIVVLPYTFSAGASGPLSTAFQHHKAIIATKTQYFAHVLEDGQNALLVPPRNSEELARAIVRLLEDESLRKKFAKNIQEKAEKTSWAKVAQTTAQLYQKLLCSPWN
jgi:glycosyltransferase involved in cell wall biosynthesis